MTTSIVLDGLLDDDMPEERTARELADEQGAHHETVPAPTISPDPGDGAVAPAATAMTPSDTTAAPDPAAREKLVIVEGQTFVVDAAIDTETIRAHLIRQGFANLAGAEVRTGTRSHNGQILATIDFIKRAGTKG
ncbi:MAG: hypothetical protein RLZZ387_4925 [Chloroflexota bacterium]|jgi:hypothetical protein